MQRKAGWLRSTTPPQRAVPSRSAQPQPTAEMTARRYDLALTVMLWELVVLRSSRIVSLGCCVHQCRTAVQTVWLCAISWCPGTRFAMRVTLWEQRSTQLAALAAHCPWAPIA